MIGGTFLSLLPKGLFKFAVEGGVCGKMSKSPDNKVRKRDRDDIRTPRLVVSPFSCGCVHDGVCNNRPRKRLRGDRKIDDLLQSSPSSPSSCTGSIPVARSKSSAQQEHKKKKQTSDLIKKLPSDVVAACLSFLGTTEDRHALQNTCKSFREISNSDVMLEKVNIVGDLDSGKGGILQENDTPASASAALAPFARAGNLQALYM